jgi:hypothetical protein
MGRKFLASCFSVFVLTVPAFAAEKAAITDADTVAEVTTIAPAIEARASWSPISRRPSILPALYGGSAALQAFDAYSTLKALNGGAVEANPLMKGATSNPAVFIGVKATVAAASILAAERLWHDHHRVAAIAMMAASNGIMAVVAAHNASVLSSQQR